MSTGAQDETIDAIRRAAERAADGLGVELVEVTLRRSGRNSLLRVDIDRPGTLGVGIDDCQRMSARLGDALDETDLIPDSYTLEVSSPGIDRPLRTDDDLRRNAGRRVVARVSPALGGVQEIYGLLVEAESEFVVIRVESGDEIRLARSGIVKLQQDPGFDAHAPRKPRRERGGGVL